MTYNWKLLFRFGFIVLSALSIIFFATDFLDLEVIFQITPSILLISCGFYSISVFFNLIGWRVNLKAWNTGKIDHWKLLRSTGFLLIGKYIPGKVFGLLARMAEYQSEAFRSKLLMSMTVLEQLSILQAAIFLTLILWALGLHDGLMSMLVVAVGVAGFFLNLTRPLDKLSLILIRCNPRFGFLRISRMPRYYYHLTFIAVFSILSNCFALYFVTAGLLGFEAITWEYVFLSSVFSFLLGYLVPIAPAGLGIRDFGLMGLLSVVLTVGEAATIALLFRTLAFLLDITIGLTLVGLGWVSKVEGKTRPE